MSTPQRICSWRIATVVAALAPSHVLADLDDGLLAHWSFEHGKACDLMCNGHNGVVHGAARSEGFEGHCLLFDGDDDFVQVTNTTSMTFANSSCTFAAWIQIAKNTNDYDYFLKLSNAELDNPWPYIELAKARSGWLDGRLFFQLATSVDPSDAARAYSDAAGPSLLLDAWTHVAGVVNADVGTITLYVNGAPQQHVEWLIPFDLNDAPQLELTIGRNWSSSWPGFHEGPIDEVRIYDRALNGAEIDELAKRPCPADLNGDGVVDLSDLGALLAVYGANCP